MATAKANSAPAGARLLWFAMVRAICSRRPMRIAAPEKTKANHEAVVVARTASAP
jgi:hypothetical protein